MAENHFDQGQLVKIAVVFTVKATGSALDPDVVKVSVKAPDGTLTTYTYNTNVEVVRTAVGTYHYQLSLSQAGRYYIRWFSTGTGQAANEVSVVSDGAKAI